MFFPVPSPRGTFWEFSHTGPLPPAWARTGTWPLPPVANADRLRRLLSLPSLSVKKLRGAQHGDESENTRLTSQSTPGLPRPARAADRPPGHCTEPPSPPPPRGPGERSVAGHVDTAPRGLAAVLPRPRSVRENAQTATCVRSGRRGQSGGNFPEQSRPAGLQHVVSPRHAGTFSKHLCSRGPALTWQSAGVAPHGEGIA